LFEGRFVHGLIVTAEKCGANTFYANDPGDRDETLRLTSARMAAKLGYGIIGKAGRPCRLAGKREPLAGANETYTQGGTEKSALAVYIKQRLA
jgi:hypothetical protein